MSKTKCLAIVLFLSAILLFVPNFSHAAELEYTDTAGITWGYELDENDNVVNLCCKTENVSGNITIPSEIEGKTVVSIEPFSGNAGITGITIPNTVITIEEYAFYNCTGLKSVIMPDSVQVLESSAFRGCSGITEVTFSKNLVSIGSYAFSGCEKLKSAIIPNSVNTIGNTAFEGCKKLEELVLSENLYKIEHSTFNGCSELKSVIIPNSVTTIDGYDGFGGVLFGAFAYCKNLEKILIPDSVATIAPESFYACNKLTIYGNNDQESKAFAEEEEIKFDLIENWDKEDAGLDITAPTVKSIKVTSDSLEGAVYTSSSSTYTVPTDTKLVIDVNFSEAIEGTTAPTLTIKIGTGSNITLTNGTINGTKVSYTYTTKTTDVGIIATVSLKGGDLKDAAENEAELSCPVIGIEGSDNVNIYVNGAVVGTDNEDDEDGTNGKKTYNGHKYLIYEKNMTWAEAKAFCEKQGGHLVTITTKGEQDFIESYIKEKGYAKNRFWIGASSTGSKWSWVTGEKFDYENWGDKQPSGGQANAVLHSYRTKYNGGWTEFGEWDDLYANGDSKKDVYFICEWGTKIVDTSDDDKKTETTDKKEETTNKKDNTTASGVLPQTGKSYFVIMSIVVVAIIAVVTFKKARYYKDIK